MRIVITVEDSQLPPATEPPLADQKPAGDAGVALQAASLAAPADRRPPDPAAGTLTQDAISAGPAPEPPAAPGPIFLAQSAVATEPAPNASEGSADLSAGPAPPAG